MKKSFFAAIFAATMAVSSLGSTPAYASVFSDINSVPWPEAAQYIDEAYSLGLMAGYVENGQRYCKPKNNVTYCEAVQLMYALMSSYTGTSVSSSVVTKWTSTMVAENIPSWAYNAVAYALENSILSKNDISIFMASSSTQNNARREDVAVIFGKALSKVYGLSASPSLTYADKDQIASTSVPYVELLNRLGIMVGDANNKFNPKVNINRAEMSVLVTKTYNKLKSGGGTTTTPGAVVQYSGKVTEKTSSGSGYSISLSVSGSTKTFTTNASTTVTGADGKSSSVSKISTGDSIVAVCNNGVATTIIVMSEGSESTTTKSGSINNISDDEIVLKTSSGNKTYDIEDEDIDVTIDGSNSSLSSLINKFKGGRNYTVKLYLDDDDVVTKIEAEEGSDTGDYDKDAIKSLSESSVKTYGDDRYNFPDDVTDTDITLDGDSVDYDELEEAFDDLKDDEQMIIDDYELDKDDELKTLDVVIEDLETSSKSDSDESGTIKSITETRVTLDNNDKYDFADEDDIDSLEFDGDDYDADQLDDFVDDIDKALDDDEVYIELTLNSKDDIIEAVAYTCTTEEGDITDISTSSKTIEIDDDEYDYISSATVDITDGDSTITSMSKLADAFDDDKTVNVTIVLNDDDEVVAVTGYVSDVDDKTIDKFEYDKKNDSDECYIKLDTSSSSVKYYFDSSWDIDEIKDIYNDYDDGRDNASIELNDEGKIESITLD